MELQGNQYAKVAERVKEFRQAHPNGLISTEPTMREDGYVIFKARIMKDKADENSAEATGHSIGKIDSKAKSFEKLETVAVGRALALLGYSMDGEIASSEEMEEFLSQQQKKKQELVAEWSSKLEASKTLEELKVVWVDMPVEVKTVLKPRQEELKAIISSETKV